MTFWATTEETPLLNWSMLMYRLIRDSRVLCSHNMWNIFFLSRFHIQLQLLLQTQQSKKNQKIMFWSLKTWKKSSKVANNSLLEFVTLLPWGAHMAQNWKSMLEIGLKHCYIYSVCTYRLSEAFDTKIQFHAVDFPLCHATTFHFYISFSRYLTGMVVALP